ncbi:MAG: glycoside hydrolase family 47 protein, partial [bacterium]
LTGDPRYLEMGETMFRSIQEVCRVEAGYAEVADVRTGELRDYMQSFFLGETLKYAWLLFTRDPPIDLGEVVFNTEAHPIRPVWRR